jgi:chlorite dismutase
VPAGIQFRDLFKEQQVTSKSEELKQRMTDRAKKIMKLAESEAENLKDKVVGAEHMLLGMIKEGTGVASKVLRNLDVDLGSMEKTLKEHIQTRSSEDSSPETPDESAAQPAAEVADLPISITAAANECLEAASKEAEELEHSFVGSEDLLLGLLHDSKGLAGQVLASFGVKLEAAREEVQNLLSKSTKSGADSSEETGNIDLSEKGRGATGDQLSLNKRLFMQFMVFRGERDAMIELLNSQSIQAVVYQDVNDAASFGVMVYCQNPAYIIDRFQPVLSSSSSQQIHDYTMMGRTYSIGYENDLEDVLIRRPVKRICNPETPWAVYYPVRRNGSFEQQSKSEQRKMLMEHGGIGHAFGKAGFATDIRLAGHGLNKDDNDFIIGLLGKELFPLSALVQRMRRTRQTAEFIDHMGPFFAGRAVWQPNFNPHATIE